MSKTLSGLVRATAAARNKTQADEKLGFREGDAWKQMARDALFKANGLPITEAQGRDKKKANRGSDFVEFFAALQKSFPENLRRHHLGDIFSLAKEINRALPAITFQLLGRGLVNGQPYVGVDAPTDVRFLG